MIVEVGAPWGRAGRGIPSRRSFSVNLRATLCALAQYSAKARMILRMDVSRPYAVLSPSLDAEVLTVLARTSRPLTGGDVARLVRRGSRRGVGLALRRLADQGVVTSQRAGNATLYALNREHLAAPAVEILAGMRDRLQERLREEIAGWELAPRHASFFGSAARGEGDERSDIDLFIVRPRGVDDDDPRWREQLDRLARNVRAWTGNRAGIAEVPEAELRRLRRERPPVVGELIHDAVALAGPPARELLASPR
jgi:predicted nucleotidyltransferase